MKRSLLLFALALAACGGGETSGDTTPPDVSATSAAPAEPTDEATTAEPTDEQTPTEDTETEGPQPTLAPGELPDTCTLLTDDEVTTAFEGDPIELIDDERSDPEGSDRSICVWESEDGMKVRLFVSDYVAYGIGTAAELPSHAATEGWEPVEDLEAEAYFDASSEVTRVLYADLGSELLLSIELTFFNERPVRDIAIPLAEAILGRV